ncbi:DUF5689 domain-containing protein [Salinimicrobium sp. GXAS 041]|uniref:DUF5689 domain-containing protein n=1 Tax=Salinimicrobium sp. GXAS 041 TaxID=3400806 RepID=UPI003C72828D
MKNCFSILPKGLLLLCLTISSCVPDDEFEVPPSAVIKGLNIETNSDLYAVLGAYFQNGGEIVTFEQEVIVAVYVVSSDKAGNFYKELIVQDKPIDPIAGLAVQINLPSYYETYDFGRKLYLKLKGLSIGEKSGVVSLGVLNGRQIDPIPLSQLSQHILRTSEVVEIVPKTVKAVDFSDRMENLYVKLEDIQFSKMLVNDENPVTYASEGNDEFDGERKVESCTGDFPFVLSTSTYANFKSLKLPVNSGSLQGILTRDFYDDFFTIYLNHPSDVHFDEEGRCDPETFDCGRATEAGKNVLFKEEFQGQKNNTPIKGNGWTNLVTEGSEGWEGFTATGVNASLGRSARVQTTGSGDYLTESWLITPPIDFDVQEGEVLEFKTSTSFANNSILEVLFSTDWDGTEENFYSATWRALSSAYVAQRTDFFGDWISSGKVSLSCAEGIGYVAFKYTGSDRDYYNGIYELDDIFITSD